MLEVRTCISQIIMEEILGSSQPHRENRSGFAGPRTQAAYPSPYEIPRPTGTHYGVPQRWKRSVPLILFLRQESRGMLRRVDSRREFPSYRARGQSRGPLESEQVTVRKTGVKGYAPGDRTTRFLGSNSEPQRPEGIRDWRPDEIRTTKI
jgi:hypothetical protein